MKLLVQLLEIKEGKRLSVSKADDWSKFPSISVINQHKKEVLTKIVDQNIKIAENIINVDASNILKTDNLQKHFDESRRYKKQILNSKRANASMATSPGSNSRILLKISENRQPSNFERACCKDSPRSPKKDKTSLKQSIDFKQEEIKEDDSKETDQPHSKQ